MVRKYTLKTSKQSSSSGIDYESELNAEQYLAVSSPPGRALVIAGAGSGKTRTLTYRVAWLLDHGVSPHEILLLTFTNKASKEMVERVRQLVVTDVTSMWAGTFHSIGSRILRRHAEELGYDRSFSIMDRDDQKSMISSVVKECNIDNKQRRFPKSDVIASVISMCENTGGELKEVVLEHFPKLYEWHMDLERVYEKYVDRKKATNSMDFDDLLVLTVELLVSRPKVLRDYQNRFRHVLVDEYQDTNSVQSKLIDLLTGGGSSLMAVGDDAQSIYSWRGADVSLILGFRTRYPDAQVITIETNYRSVPEILELSNKAISVNQGRYDKDLRASRPSLGVKPAAVSLPCPVTQAEFVVQRIMELRDEGVPLREIAVLYRAHFQSMEVQMALTSKQVEFGITSGIRFFEQSHIKDVTAMIRFVMNRKDRGSFERMAGLLPGCGVATVEKLWRAWEQSGWSDSERPPSKWSDVMLKFSVPKRSAVQWRQMCYILDEMVTDGKYARPDQMIFSILEGMYEEYLVASFDNAELRKADIERLSSFSSEFEDPAEFLEQLSLLGNVDGEVGQKKATSDERVTLSSIHQAKGLEWKVVFVIWLVDGQFPNQKILESMDDDAMEEERRLFYVALTRAKDELYLTYPMTNPRSYSGDYFCMPSSFLGDCPEEMLEVWDVEASPKGDRWGDWDESEPF